MRLLALIAVLLTAFVLSWPFLWPPDVRQVVLQNGIHVFPGDVEGICAYEQTNCPVSAAQSAGDPFWGKYAAAVCAPDNKNKCVCQADVTYPVIGRGKKRDVINEAFKKLADKYICSAGTATTELHYDKPFVQGSIVSMKFNGYQSAVGAQGGCHSGIVAVTANSETGQVYTLADIVDKNKEAALKGDIIKYFAAHFAGEQKDAIKTLKNKLDKNLWDSIFYFKGGQLFIDLNEYLLSCADGPSFVILISPDYIVNKDILDTLKP